MEINATVNNEKQLSRKERERLLRRNEIIAAAREVFALRGYNMATLDEIAEKAEFGKGTLYNYFDNKEQLFDAVIMSSYEAILNIANSEIANENRSFRTIYSDIARRVLDLLLRNSGIFMLLTRELSRPGAQKKHIESFTNFVALMELPLKAAVERGEVPECHTEDVAAMFISSIFSIYKYRFFKQCVCHNEVVLVEIPTFSEDGIKKEIEHIMNILDFTYFDGLLCPKK
jgi:TetR/AcrR family transcriptional regulator, repressor of fatR-cypB operon